MAYSCTDVLFRPLQIGSLALPNRIVMAPMTRLFSRGGIVGPANAAYYRRRAEAGVGLILSEGTVIDRPASRNHPDIPIFYGEQALEGWRNVVADVHEKGGRMAPQLWHTGAVQSLRTEWVPDGQFESASDIELDNSRRGYAMSESAIADTVMAFANAALAAVRLGFDAVEIHGAHGYLIDQFFWNATNRRQDRYGGTVGERSRFAAEIISAVRKAVGPDFPIIIRVSQWKQQDYTARIASNPAELAEWIEPLVGAGANVIHCSQRRFWEAEFPEVDGEEGLNLAGWAKKITGAFTISVGSVGLSGDFIGAFTGSAASVADLGALIQRMERDEFDLVAVGRALLADASWVAKIKAGAFDDLRPFDPACLAVLE